jgi:rubrerythrin
MPTFSGSEIVDIAKQIEAAGEAFYSEALKHLKGAQIRRVFEFLRDEERRHADVFETLLAGFAEAQGEWRQDEDYLAYLRALGETRVFPDLQSARSAVSDLQDESAAIRHALDFEKDSILFLHELRTMAREESRAIVDQLIAEERGHVRTLNRLLSVLEGDPATAE